jgi:hypothetical protein
MRDAEKSPTQKAKRKKGKTNATLQFFHEIWGDQTVEGE